jgi:hypothetical protein
VTKHKALTSKIVLVPGALSPHRIAHSLQVAGAIGMTASGRRSSAPTLIGHQNKTIVFA